mmetsp:Transcript_48279/g.71972  ORF Transcript_48279/g.71972 Transcript_48279/m.71972 type:complete len:84 (-) Transcript_48279:226-477(-)
MQTMLVNELENGIPPPSTTASSADSDGGPDYEVVKRAEPMDGTAVSRELEGMTNSNAASSSSASTSSKYQQMLQKAKARKKFM